MKIIQGQVTKVNDQKTARVVVSRKWTHPLYKKITTRTKSYLCDYQDIKLAVGDEVIMQECRPISKRKRFRIVKQQKKGSEK